MRRAGGAERRFSRLAVRAVEVERPIRLQGIYKRDVRVGNNVWIGYGACILRGVTVGDNAIIGTNAVVTRDVPANAVAVTTESHANLSAAAQSTRSAYPVNGHQYDADFPPALVGEGRSGDQGSRIG